VKLPIKIGITAGGQRSANQLEFMYSPPPRLIGLAPAIGNESTAITLRGTSFGSGDVAPSTITIDGKPSGAPPSTWTDTQITFNLPTKHPDGRAWPDVKVPIKIGVEVGDRRSVTEFTFTYSKGDDPPEKGEA
jgi:hypothetical protein